MFETLLFVNGVVLVCFKHLLVSEGVVCFGIHFETPTALPFEDYEKPRLRCCRAHEVRPATPSPSLVSVRISLTKLGDTG